MRVLRKIGQNSKDNPDQIAETFKGKALLCRSDALSPILNANIFFLNQKIYITGVLYFFNQISYFYTLFYEKNTNKLYESSN